MNSDEAIAQVARLPERAGAASCFGDPVSHGDRTVIPVAEVSFGFGFGWGQGSGPQGEGEGGGGGAGGGARARGIAAIDVGPTGVRILPIEDQTALRLASITFASTSTAIVARTLLKLLRG
jgi:uncharacterized spore protein YtfJ